MLQDPKIAKVTNNNKDSTNDLSGFVELVFNVPKRRNGGISRVSPSTQISCGF